MAEKVYDMAVKVGEYTNSDGEKKNRYHNIGAVWKGENGSFATLRRTFSPAGVPADPDKDSIIISFFEPKKENADIPF